MSEIPKNSKKSVEKSKQSIQNQNEFQNEIFKDFQDENKKENDKVRILFSNILLYCHTLFNSIILYFRQTMIMTDLYKAIKV